MIAMRTRGIVGQASPPCMARYKARRTSLFRRRPMGGGFGWLLGVRDRARVGVPPAPPHWPSRGSDRLNVVDPLNHREVPTTRRPDHWHSDRRAAPGHWAARRRSTAGPRPHGPGSTASA
jgi:hypothetical protein